MLLTSEVLDRHAEPILAAVSGAERSSPHPCCNFDHGVMGQPLAKATAKVAAYCSAHLFANVAPKFHNDMRASMDNALRANVQVNPVAKAFCDCYLSTSSDDHSVTTNIQLLSGGSVSAVVVAVVLTEQWWPLFLFVLLLVGGIGGGMIWAFGCKEQCDSEVLQAMAAMVPAADAMHEAALQVRTQPKLAKAVMEKLLKVDPGSIELYSKDSSVQGIIDYVVTYTKFVYEYGKMTYSMPSAKILQKVAGQELPADLQGKSIREVAESLRDRLQDESKKWCKSYHCINKFLTTGVQRAEQLILMQQTGQDWSGRVAVEEGKMKKALKVEDLEEAVKVLAASKQDLIREARVLVHNIHLSNPDFHDVYSEMESLVDMNGQLAEEQKTQDGLAKEKAEAARHHAQNATRLQQLQRAKSGVQEHLEYCRDQLKRVTQQLEAARGDEKNYTWWMFGARTYMWENDVKLAKEKVETFNQQKEKLERCIEEIQNGTAEASKNLLEEEARVQGQSCVKCWGREKGHVCC